MKTLKSLEIKDVQISDNFWNKPLLLNKNVTLDHIYDQLKKTKRIDNFYNAAKKEGKHSGRCFNDSDIYKWLEAASYYLEKDNDKDLIDKVDKIILAVKNAQEDDGYLNTYFSLVEPQNKWKNLSFGHEFYCAGHLFEAAAAHFKATKERSLLNIAYKFADHIVEQFGADRVQAIPGHEEIELALIKLYRIDKKRKYLEMTEYFIKERGRKNSPLKKVFKNSKKVKLKNQKQDNFNFFYNEEGEYNGEYSQDHLEVENQVEPKGHAVRALYFYNGITDFLLENNDKKLMNNLELLWKNIYQKQMYITGGLGSSHINEGFIEDYYLPNKTAYSETCASVASIMWNSKMIKLFQHSKFGDLIEKTLYNALLSGVSLDGKHFFYLNPLESDGRSHPFSYIGKDRFTIERKEWMHTACCPPNLLRLLASLEKYIYYKNSEENSIYISQYISSKANIGLNNNIVKLKQNSAFPWQGKVKIEINIEDLEKINVYLRVPEWSEGIDLSFNGQKISPKINDDGYIRIKIDSEKENKIILNFKMKNKLVESSSLVSNNIGKVTIKRGPIIYCFEEIDNPLLDNIFIKRDQLIEEEYKDEILDGVLIMKSKAYFINNNKEKLYSEADSEINYELKDIKAIPYYSWANRGKSKMKVWMNSDVVFKE